MCLFCLISLSHSPLISDIASSVKSSWLFLGLSQHLPLLSPCPVHSCIMAVSPELCFPCLSPHQAVSTSKSAARLISYSRGLAECQAYCKQLAFVEGRKGAKHLKGSRICHPPKNASQGYYFELVNPFGIKEGSEDNMKVGESEAGVRLQDS